MALFALTVNTVKLPRERRSRTTATADKQAEAVSLDMTGYWRPTVRSRLPALMRTPRAAQGSTESPQADAVTEEKDLDAYAVAAE
jgi:ParB family chromosome partitioning protein